jgi:ABC-type antimicrobial peptide transport system permease subunit
MAMGAVPGQLAQLVLREGLRLALLGGALGLGLTVWLGGLVESRLYGVGAFDPASIASAALLLSLVSLAAAWLPARRAARVDPIVALRME